MSVLTDEQIKRIAQKSMPPELPRNLVESLAACKNDEERVALLDEFLPEVWASAISARIKAAELERIALGGN